MSKNQTNEESQHNHEQLNHNLEVRNLEANSTANSLSRRSFLGRAGASTVAVAAASVGLPAMLSENAEGQIAEQTARSDRSLQIRLNAATRESKVPIPPQINNGDEARYANFIGNFSQGLPHNSIGEVDPTAYQALLTAVTSGKPSDFANIPLGGTVKLAGPQGGLAFDLEGTDSGQLSIPRRTEQTGQQCGVGGVTWPACIGDLTPSKLCCSVRRSRSASCGISVTRTTNPSTALRSRSSTALRSRSGPCRCAIRFSRF